MAMNVESKRVALCYSLIETLSWESSMIIEKKKEGKKPVSSEREGKKGYVSDGY